MQAQSKSDVEDACRDRLASRGYRSVKLDDEKYDRRPSGVVLTAKVRSGRDRYDMECRVNREGRVRDLDLRRRGNDDNDGRPGNNGKPRIYETVRGADRASFEQQMRTVGYEPKGAQRGGWDYWFLGSTGDCVAVRMVGNRVADMRQAAVRDCR